MTITKRYLAELKDLLFLRLTCAKCNASLAIPFSKERDHIPDECPYCKEKWFVSGSTDGRNLTLLMDSIRQLKAGSGDGCKVHVETTIPE